MKKMYLTTPIYYVNDIPHIGHAYNILATDTLARYWRGKLGRKNVFFLTGTDENSQKTVDAAAAKGQEIFEYLEEMSMQWRTTWESIGIDFDDFIRTTEERHVKTVHKIFNTIYNKGEIYKGEYKGLYCTGCEAFLKETDLDENGNCPDHGRPPEVLAEENYFFRLSAYEDQLLELFAKGLLMPEKRKNEMVSFIKSGLEDVSISRESAEFGIELPMDESHKVYVWFDALINYYSAIKQDGREDFWNYATHIIGKDISKFHTIIWPAMLIAAGIKPPQSVFAHGFFTIDGTKMSKTLGNVVSPLDLSEKFGNDALRIGLLSSFEFGNDGDFSLQNFESFYSSKLAGGVGNLFNRVIVLLHKFQEGRKPSIAVDDTAVMKSLGEFNALLEQKKLKAAIDLFFEVVGAANELMNETEVWKMAKVDPAGAEEVFAKLIVYLEVLTKMSQVFLPESAVKMQKMLGDDSAVGEAEILFGKVEISEAVSARRKISVSLGPKLAKVGYKVRAALCTVPKVSKERNAALREYIDQDLKDFDPDLAAKSPHFDEAHRIYEYMGLSGKHPAEHLIAIFKKSKKLPNINSVVDSYNIESITRGLSYGVHDLEKIAGNVKFAFTEGGEKYTELGTDQSISVSEGEYGCLDEEKVLCRLDWKQCNETKIGNTTRHLLVYVEGNKAVSETEMDEALNQVLENLKNFCGASDIEVV